MAEEFKYQSQIQQGEIVQSWHVSQSVEAFTGAKEYDIVISGSETISGSLYIDPNTLLSTAQTYRLSYNNTTGQVFKTLASEVSLILGVSSIIGNNLLAPDKPL